MAPDPETWHGLMEAVEAEADRLAQYDDERLVDLIQALDIASERGIEEISERAGPDGSVDDASDIDAPVTTYAFALTELRSRDFEVDRVAPTDPEAWACGLRIVGPDDTVYNDPEPRPDETRDMEDLAAAVRGE